MRRVLVVGALAALVATAGGVSDLIGQTVSPSRFDIGVYAGGSWTSDWFESRTVTTSGGVITENDDAETYGIGMNPAFGGAVTWWAMPMFGVRLHGAFIPSDLPRSDDEERTGFFESSPRLLNNWLYDLNLVLRPWAAQVGGSALVSSAYLFAGGGAMEVGIPGDQDACIPSILALGACLSTDSDHDTVGQGVVGLGFDLLSVTNSLGIFAELAGHGYRSPAHVDDEFVPRVTVQPGGRVAVADDKFAVTTRLVAGLKVALGGGAQAPMAMAPPPPPPPPAPPAPPPAPAAREIMVCVIDGGQPRTVAAMFDPTSRDTMVAGQAFATRYPATAPTYAAAAPWFARSDSLTYQDRAYVRFGVTRVVQPPQLASLGLYQGTALFGESGAAEPQAVLYVPVRPGCEFQPYRLREAIRPRG